MKRYTIAVDETEHAEIADWLARQKNVSGAVRCWYDTPYKNDKVVYEDNFKWYRR